VGIVCTLAETDGIAYGVLFLLLFGCRPCLYALQGVLFPLCCVRGEVLSWFHWFGLDTVWGLGAGDRGGKGFLGCRIAVQSWTKNTFLH